MYTAKWIVKQEDMSECKVVSGVENVFEGSV